MEGDDGHGRHSRLIAEIMMFGRLRQLLVMLTAAADKKASQELGRKAAILGAKMLRGGGIAEKLAGFGEIAKFHADETGTWVSPDVIRSGLGGPFDACDLRHWIEIAELAGVPSVPASEILKLSEDEMAFLSGKVEIPDTAARRAVRRIMDDASSGAREELAKIVGDSSDLADDPIPSDPEALFERLYASMDELPEGWMVRYARCGSSELKSFAGAGAAGPEVPEVRFGSDLEIGPGWVRNGNRRRVHVSDARTVQMAAEGPGGDAVFLARPWVQAARYIETDDPHRHGTPFAGKGVWPAEWRAFVENGEVVGVSFYYGWAGVATSENARIALEVRDIAQAMADAASGEQAWPRYMDVEFVRNSKHAANYEKHLETFGREAVSCTLDFIETRDGVKFLEGGPPNTPFGGGHPCSFAGCGGQPRHGNKTETVGVAFRMMPHVLIGDPSTWTEGDRSGCILTWDEVMDLAVENSPSP